MIDVITTLPMPPTSTSLVEEKEENKEATVILINQIRSLINQKLQVEIPGAITPTGVDQIVTTLNLAGYHSLARCDLEATDFEWTWQTKKGNLPKRLAKYIKKRSGKVLDPELLAKIGNIAREHSSTAPEPYYFMIVDKVDWNGNQLGKDDSSCWWGFGGRSISGIMETGSYCDRFIKEGGLGVKFFSTDTYINEYGIGRLWLCIEPENQEYAVAFNGYWHGQGATLRLSKVLATLLGLSYQKIGVKSTHTTNYDGTGGRFYVNSYVGYMIGTQQAIDSNMPDKEKYLDLPSVEPKVHCVKCSVRIPESTAFNYEYATYCKSCKQELFTSCGSCYKAVLKLDTRLVSRGRNTLACMVSYCMDCTGRRARTCHTCGVVHDIYIRSTSRITEEEDSYYFCSKYCTRLSRGRCIDCGSRTINIDANGDYVCRSCEDQFEGDISISNLGYPEIVLDDNYNVVPDAYGNCLCSICTMARLENQ